MVDRRGGGVSGRVLQRKWRNRLLALLKYNAGTGHWPINKFRLNRASQHWLYRSKITAIMKRLMEWLTLTCPLH